MIRPANTGTASRPSLGGDASSTQGRPPTAGQNANQIEELHRNNRLVRPVTGDARKKPPVGQRSLDEDDQNEAILGLLDESAHGNSNQGSLTGAPSRLGVPGLKTPNQLGNTYTGSHADFERADDDLEGVDARFGGSQGDDAPSDSDDDEGGFYQPTALARVSPANAVKTKKPEPKKSTSRSPDKGLNPPTPGGAMGSIIGSDAAG